MRRRREFMEGASYHITSRTNNKIPVFDKYFGRRIMLLVLECIFRSKRPSGPAFEIHKSGKRDPRLRGEIHLGDFVF